MVRLIPLSSKAKNRLANQLGNDPEVNLEQRTGTKVFVVAKNGRWCAWVDLKGDPNWDLVFTSSSSDK